MRSWNMDLGTTTSKNREGLRTQLLGLTEQQKNEFEKQRNEKHKGNEMRTWNMDCITTTTEI